MLKARCWLDVWLDAGSMLCLNATSMAARWLDPSMGKGPPREGPARRHVRGEGVRDDLVGLEHWCAL